MAPVSQAHVTTPFETSDQLARVRPARIDNWSGRPQAHGRAPGWHLASSSHAVSRNSNLTNVVATAASATRIDVQTATYAPFVANVYVKTGAVVATASASGASARVFAQAGTATARASASGAVAYASGVVTLVVVVREPHPHLPADHDDPVVVGMEAALVLAVIFVGAKAVAARLLRG